MSAPATSLHYLLYLFLLVLLPCNVHAQRADVHTAEAPTSIQPRQLQAASSIRFTANRGQIIDNRGDLRPDILYKAESKGVSLYFTRQGVSYVFSQVEGELSHLEQCHAHGKDHALHAEAEREHPRLHQYRMDLELLGASPGLEIVAEDVTDEYFNYYLAHCPSGIINVPSYRRLIYKGVYPSIDMVVHASGEGAKADFIVHPGGRVEDIRLRYVAADRVGIESDGSLRATTPLGYLHEGAPYSYLRGEGDEAHQPVASSYRMADGIISFAVGEYDRTRTLVVDPEQVWGTFYGGPGRENLNGGDPTEVDRNSNVLITGYTLSTQFIATPGADEEGYLGGFSFGDVFLVKFNSRGAIQWGTYFGGSNDEIGHGVAADKDGNVFITGHTEGAVPFQANSYRQGDQGDRDAFVAKFSPAGALLWSTNVGGSGWDDGYGFAVDSNDNVAVLVTTGSDGQAPSTAFQPVRKGGYDVLLVKFGRDGGQPLWSTYYGGTGTDYSYAAASDIDDNIVFTGWTNSSGAPANKFPVSADAFQPDNRGGFDAYVVKFSSSGSRLWGTYYGGSGTENSSFSGSVGFCGITTDGDKNVLITGTTSSGNLLVTDGTYRGGGSDAFVAKFDPDGRRLWATYVGSSAADVGSGIAASPNGNVLVTGFTGASSNFPITSLPKEPAFQATYQGGSNDAYIVKFNAAGEQRWGTYFGGGNDDQGHGISFDPFGFIIVAGHTLSSGDASGKPFALGRSSGETPWQTINRSNTDAFISVFCDPVPPTVDSSGPTTFCHDQSLTLSIDPGYTRVEWFRNTETAPFSTSHSITITQSGEYYVKVESTGGCPAASPRIKVKRLDRPNPQISAPPAFCSGDSVNLIVAGGPYASYVWKRNGTLIPDASSATLKVKQGGTYRVIVTDAWGCPDSTEQIATEYPVPGGISVTPADTIEICEGDPPVQLTAVGGSGGTIQWSNGASGGSISVTQQGLYSARSVTPNGCSTASNKVYVKVNPKPPIKILNLLPLEFCAGDSTVLVANPGNYVEYLWSTGERTTQITVKQSRTITLTVTDAKGCRNTAEVTVTRHEQPTPRIAPSGPLVLCEGESVNLRVEGGSFQGVRWSNGATGGTVQITKGGTYFATASNGAGCTANSDTVTVTVNPKPNVTIAGSLEVCTNSSESYSVPPQPDVTYQWSITGSGATITSGGATNTITVNWGPAGNGTVSVTATNSVTKCTATNTIDVVVGSALVPSITESRSPQLCPGDSVTLDAGGGYSSYRWSTGATTRRITVGAAGSYTVTVENAGGCSGTSRPFVVTLTDGPKPAIVASGSTLLCPGDTVYLTTSQPYDEYAWSGGQSIDRIAVWSAGTYSVTVTDANGCVGTSEAIEVRIATPPAPVVTGPSSVCINSEQSYSVADVAGDSYQWTVQGGTAVSALNAHSIRVNWPVAGRHLLTLTQRSGASGCQTRVEYEVTVGTTLQPQITTNKSTLICDGDSIELFADEGYASYAWEDGSRTRSIVVREAGTYRVTVSDIGGCSGTGEITIARKLPLDAGVSPSGRVGICDGDSIMLEARSGFSSYLWSTGETTRAIYVKDAGPYTVTVTDADGCTGVSPVIDLFIHPTLATPEITAIGDTLEAVFPSIGSAGSLSYQWYLDDAAIGGANGPRYYTQVVGSYRVRVIDSNGCSSLSEPFSPTAAATATIALPQLSAAPGQRVQLPLMMTESHNLDRLKATRFSGELRFRKGLLVLADARFSSRIDGDDQVVSIQGDRPELMSSGELLRVEFIAALGDRLSTPLELRLLEWSDTQAGSVAVRKLAGSFTLEEICVSGGERLVRADGNVAIKGVRPNPVSGGAEVEYEVVEDGPTRLVVVDMLGREVVRLVDGEVEAGRYMVKLETGSLSSGTYMLLLQTPSDRLHHIIQVEK